MKLTDAQYEALRELDEALKQAGECDLLGMVLQGNCANPDSINDLCDAVDYVLKEQA